MQYTQVTWQPWNGEPSHVGPQQRSGRPLPYASLRPVTFVHQVQSRPLAFSAPRPVYAPLAPYMFLRGSPETLTRPQAPWGQMSRAGVGVQAQPLTNEAGVQCELAKDPYCPSWTKEDEDRLFNDMDELTMDTGELDQVSREREVNNNAIPTKPALTFFSLRRKIVMMLAVGVAGATIEGVGLELVERLVPSASRWWARIVWTLLVAALVAIAEYALVQGLVSISENGKKR